MLVLQGDAFACSTVPSEPHKLPLQLQHPPRILPSSHRSCTALGQTPSLLPRAVEESSLFSGFPWNVAVLSSSPASLPRRTKWQQLLPHPFLGQEVHVTNKSKAEHGVLAVPHPSETWEPDASTGGTCSAGNFHCVFHQPNDLFQVCVFHQQSPSEQESWEVSIWNVLGTANPRFVLPHRRGGAGQVRWGCRYWLASQAA